MNRVFLILLAYLFVSCRAGLPNHVSEKMDIAHYNSIQVNGIAHFTLKNGTIVEQSFAADGGYIQKSVLPSYFNYPSFDGVTVYKEFYNTGELKQWGPLFCGQFYGRHKIWGKDGNAINELQFETPYKFSLVNVRNKIKKEFGVDLFKTKVPVSRSVNPPIYKVLLPGERQVTIDANTGVIISNVTKAIAK